MLTLVKLLFILSLPAAFIWHGFRRWRAHYGEGSLAGYYMRYVTQKRATDDPAIIFLAKAMASVAWVMLGISYLF